jgi:hypothetical protein
MNPILTLVLGFGAFILAWHVFWFAWDAVQDAFNDK